MPAKWIDYKGRKVLSVDSRGLDSKGFVAVLDQGSDLMSASPTKVLYMVNLEGATVSREVMEWFRTKGTAQASKGEKYAVVGSSGVQKVMVDAAFAVFGKAGAPGRTFKTEKEALDWLVG